MSKDKDKAGNFFSMGDEQQRPKEGRQSRRELENLRGQFMDRAKQFMDDSALGEGRKMVEKLIGKVQDFVAEPEEEGEVWEGEMLDADAPETPFGAEDDEDAPWEEHEPEGLDWSRPEYIRAGYAKPGSKIEMPKTLEEAQEESFSLKMGNLSGLLSRFGSEDASPEAEQRQISRHRTEMDKPLLRAQMDQLYAELGRQAGTDADPRLWLHPEVLTLLRARNQPHRILLFAMAALFASTDENYLTESDQDWIRELMERAGFLLEPKEIQRVVEQTFIFPERVHRLYESLLAEPVQIVAEHFDVYRENLSKLYIYEVASRYQAEPQNVIRTLASYWQEAASQLQQALSQAIPITEQYARFQQRKMASSTIFQKLRQAQEGVLVHFEKMQAVAREVEALKQVTRLIEEEEALERLNQFRTDLVLLPAECIGSAPISLYDLRGKFVQAQLEALRNNSSPVAGPQEGLEISPVEQKHAISRAKEGEIKSLRLIENYKAWRIAQLVPAKTAEEVPASTSATAPPVQPPVSDQDAAAPARPAADSGDASIPAESLSTTPEMADGGAEAATASPEQTPEQAPPVPEAEEVYARIPDPEPPPAPAPRAGTSPLARPLSRPGTKPLERPLARPQPRPITRPLNTHPPGTGPTQPAPPVTPPPDTP